MASDVREAHIPRVPMIYMAVHVRFVRLTSGAIEYDLNYRDKNGNPKPVKFAFYIWKRIDGLIIDSLKKELREERRPLTLGLCDQRYATGVIEHDMQKV